MPVSMWLLIDKRTDRVVGTNYTEPPEGSYDPARIEVKEWLGPEPFLGDTEQGTPADFDPTLDDPGYLAFLQCRVDFESLAEQAATEIDWLSDTMPQIDGMTVGEVRAVVKRMARENLEMLRAWRYVFRRLV